MAEGATTFPTDSAGEKAVGLYDGTNFYHHRLDNTTAKNLRVAFYDAAGNPLLAAAAPLADGAAVPTTSKIGAVPMAYTGSNLELVRLAPVAGGGALGTTGVLAAAAEVWDTTAATYRAVRSAAGVLDGVGGAGTPTVAPWLFNEQTFDRQRNNTSATVLASAARTATMATALLTNHNGRGIQVDVGVTAKAATTTLTVQLCNAAGQIVAVATAVAAAIGGTYSVQFYPGVDPADFSPGSTVGQGRSVAVPRFYILQIVPSDANSVTYSVTVFTM